MSSAAKHKQRSRRSYRTGVVSMNNFLRHSYAVSMEHASMRTLRHTDILGGLRGAVAAIRHRENPMITM